MGVKSRERILPTLRPWTMRLSKTSPPKPIEREHYERVYLAVIAMILWSVVPISSLSYSLSLSLSLSSLVSLSLTYSHFLSRHRSLSLRFPHLPNPLPLVLIILSHFTQTAPQLDSKIPLEVKVALYVFKVRSDLQIIPCFSLPLALSHYLFSFV